MTDEETLRSIWTELYGQVHDHVRESGKKRDQVIAFYLLVLAALGGAWEKLGSLRSLFLAGVCVTGVITFVIITRYRGWHVTHGAVMVTLQRLMLELLPATLDHCRDMWNQTNDTDTTFWKLMNLMRGVETGMTYLLAFLALAPLNGLVVESGKGIVHLSSASWAFVLNALLYVPILAGISALAVRRFHRFQPDLWSFRWLRTPVVETPPSPAA